MSDTADYGQLNPHDYAHEFAQQEFIINQLLGRVFTLKLVKVISCTANGDVAKPGTVNVQPLVNQIDGIGNQQSHGVINKIPYLRWGSGQNAIIADPVAGDLGIMAVFDRDSSSALAARGQANPGSNRRFSLSDGVYLGGLPGAAPKLYARFSSDAVEIGFGTAPIVCRVTDDPKVILGNPNKPLFAVETSGGASSVVFASLEP